MGKVLWTEDGERFDKTHIGCMSGIFHALDYHLWHSNVKKIFPHRKHDTIVQRAKRNKRYKRISDDEDPFEVSKLLDNETSHIPVDQSYRKTNSTQKRSVTSRIKALVSEGDTFKDNNEKERDLIIESGPRLQRTNSIHYLETNEWVHPIIFFPENVSGSSGSSGRRTDVTPREVKDSQDILEMFEVDKEKFENILQDGSRVPVTKAKLAKSGSFPSANKSGSRNLRPAKLQDKLNEFYTISKTDKLDTRTPKLASLDKQDGENSNSHDDLNNYNTMRIRRVSSLNESADRYAQLFNFAVSKEASLRPSRSLKLTRASESLLSAQEPSFLRRNPSLPHPDNPNQEFHEAYLVTERHPVSFPVPTDKKTESSSTENHESLSEVMEKGETFLENEHSLAINVSINSTEVGEDMGGLMIEEGNPHSSQDENMESFQISEDFNLLSTSQDNLEKGIKKVDGNKNMESSMRRYQDEDDFSYVKQILERSGFIKNGFKQVWNSPNQPLDPFLFQEIESQYFHDPEQFPEDFSKLSHRLLIFELVDEVLVTMYERSVTYYPKALSSFCHIRLAPSGQLVLDEIWKHVSRLLDLKPDMEQSLDDIMAHDLGKDDGWMNLQLDSECVALDLEDLILDQVLEEVLFECRL